MPSRTCWSSGLAIRTCVPQVLKSLSSLHLAPNSMQHASKPFAPTRYWQPRTPKKCLGPSRGTPQWQDKRRLLAAPKQRTMDTRRPWCVFRFKAAGPCDRTLRQLGGVLARDRASAGTKVTPEHNSLDVAGAFVGSGEPAIDGRGERVGLHLQDLGLRQQLGLGRC